MQGWAVELQFQLLPSQTLRATPDGSVRKGEKRRREVSSGGQEDKEKDLQCFYWPTLFSLSEIIQKNLIFV